MLAGYNGTIFAYGQTSSGKTHTMEVSSTLGIYCFFIFLSPIFSVFVPKFVHCWELHVIANHLFVYGLRVEATKPHVAFSTRHFLAYNSVRFTIKNGFKFIIFILL